MHIGILEHRGKSDLVINDDATAAIAEEMLRAGVLVESDWCGSFGKSITQGLNRYVDEACGDLKILGDLELIFSDDTAAYSEGMRLPKWRELFRARPDRPIGFFAMSWTEETKPVRVRERVLALEADFPGYGYSVLELLQNAFITCIEGYGFHWAAQFLHMLEDRKDKDFPNELRALEIEAAFEKYVPKEAYLSGYRVDHGLEVAAQAVGGPHEEITAAVCALWQACRECGLRFGLSNHVRLLSWEFRIMTEFMEKPRVFPISKLYRSPACYLLWDDRDPMTRIVDDYIHMSRQSMTMTNMTWLHAFQVGFGGTYPRQMQEECAAKHRVVQKVIKMGGSEYLSFYDPNFVPTPLPDGSLDQAILALKYSLRIVKALDTLLWLLHTPKETIE